MVYVAEPGGVASDGHMLFLCEDEFHGPVMVRYMRVMCVISNSVCGRKITGE